MKVCQAAEKVRSTGRKKRSFQGETGKVLHPNGERRARVNPPFNLFLNPSLLRDGYSKWVNNNPLSRERETTDDTSKNYILQGFPRDKLLPNIHFFSFFGMDRMLPLSSGL